MVLYPRATRVGWLRWALAIDNSRQAPASADAPRSDCSPKGDGVRGAGERCAAMEDYRLPPDLRHLLPPARPPE